MRKGARESADSRSPARGSGKETSKAALRDRPLAAMLGVTGAGTVAFWALFFAGKMRATETPQDEAFEKAFPLADAWMSACCLLAARALWRGEKRGVFYSTAAGSSLVFLSLMDILYSLENGKYWPLDRDRALMLGIHLWTLCTGVFSLARSFRRIDGPVALASP
ncbi:MAG: hypothetical protein WHT46_02725 [Candidatus Geothermincolales bacterium]